MTFDQKILTSKALIEYARQVNPCSPHRRILKGTRRGESAVGLLLRCETEYNLLVPSKEGLFLLPERSVEGLCLQICRAISNSRETCFQRFDALASRFGREILERPPLSDSFTRAFPTLNFDTRREILQETILSVRIFGSPSPGSLTVAIAHADQVIPISVEVSPSDRRLLKHGSIAA